MEIDYGELDLFISWECPNCMTHHEAMNQGKNTVFFCKGCDEYITEEELFNGRSES